MVVSSDPAERLVTEALGSDLGVLVHDPVAGVAGLLHAQLPSAEIDPEKAQKNPCIYVDSGVTELFKACYRAGARKERMVVKVVGGSLASGTRPLDNFQIGKRNVLTLRKLLWKNDVALRAEHVGGNAVRSVALYVATGKVTVRSDGATAAL